MNKTYTVSEITQYLKNLISNDVHLSAVYITGEISNLKLHSSSHIYFTLKDEEASLKAVMFSNYTRTLKFVPKDGMKVIVFGYITVYERAGQYQMSVSSIVPAGAGALYLAFEQLKEKLRLKGYFNENIHKPLPLFPEKVAVITSASGAAVRDFINVASRRAPEIPIVIYDSPVQGTGAAEMIAARISQINRIRSADVIVLARGGGSIEDLWAFNEEVLADAIFRSEIPVVTGVGHETDFTIADMAADMRAPTPSAAAEMVFPDTSGIRAELRNIMNRLTMRMLSGVSGLRISLETSMRRAVIKKPDMLLGRYRQDLDTMTDRAGMSLLNRISMSVQKIDSMTVLLEKLDPENVLKRGYSLVTDKQGRPLKNIASIHEGQDITIRMHDGEFAARTGDVTVYERVEI